LWAFQPHSSEGNIQNIGFLWMVRPETTPGDKKTIGARFQLGIIREIRHDHGVGGRGTVRQIITVQPYLRRIAEVFPVDGDGVGIPIDQGIENLQPVRGCSFGINGTTHHKEC
jgi:hypothetical protein